MTAGRLLVAGATGQLGAAVVQAFGDWEVTACSSRTLDLADPAAVARMVGEVRPRAVINCAAFNDVDGAEDAPGSAVIVNALAVRSLARACEAAKAVLVHYSTDFVFDGEAVEPYDESASPAPRSHYGASKLLGEWFALDAPRALVLRVESLFGTPAEWTGRRGSLEGIVAGLDSGRDVRVFADRVVSPGYVHDIAAATRHLLTVGAPHGIYHCVNRGADTWETIAREAARLLDVEPRLQVVQTHEVRLRAPRPRYCALAVDKLARAGFDMPHWQDALQRWLDSRGLLRRRSMAGPERP
jgi:dTDP-4-dehydrorhamnose reductase